MSSQSLVRHVTNDYSVPVAFGHQDAWVRAHVDQVVIGRRGDVIARHPRCYGREDMAFDPVHSFPLIERKINALDQAAPLAEWDLPEEFDTLRRLMEAHAEDWAPRVCPGAAPCGDLRHGGTARRRKGGP